MRARRLGPTRSGRTRRTLKLETSATRRLAGPGMRTSRSRDLRLAGPAVAAPQAHVHALRTTRAAGDARQSRPRSCSRSRSWWSSPRCLSTSVVSSSHRQQCAGPALEPTRNQTCSSATEPEETQRKMSALTRRNRAASTLPVAGSGHRHGEAAREACRRPWLSPWLEEQPFQSAGCTWDGMGMPVQGLGFVWGSVWGLPACNLSGLMAWFGDWGPNQGPITGAAAANRS